MTILRKQLPFHMALMVTVVLIIASNSLGAVRKSFKAVYDSDGVTPLCARDPPSAVIPWSVAAVGFSDSSVPAVIGCGHSCTGYIGCISFNYRESQSTPAQCEIYTSVPRSCSVVMSSELCQHYEMSDFKRSCSAPPANMALNRPAYQQSTLLTQYAPLAIDGKYDTHSCTKFNADYTPWWGVDLGQAYKIQEVVVVNDVNVNTANRLDDFSVYLSNYDPQDRGLYNKAPCAQYHGTVEAFGTASVKCSTAADGLFRYVIVAGRKDAICLTEVSVFVGQNYS